MSPLEWLEWHIDGTGSLPMADTRRALETLHLLVSYPRYCRENAEHLGTTDLRGLVWDQVAKGLTQVLQPLDGVGT